MKKKTSPARALPPPKGIPEDREIITSEEALKYKSYEIPIADPQTAGAAKSQSVRKAPKGLCGAWISCGCIILGLVLLLFPFVGRVISSADGALTWQAVGEKAMLGLLSYGLPPVNAPFFEPLGSESETAGFEETTATDRADEPDTFTEDETVSGDETQTNIPPATEATTEGASEEPPGSEGQSIPIVTVDMSEKEKGAAYIVGDETCDLPEVLLENVTFPEGTAVLLIHSHPYEAYGDGGDEAWYRDDGWAVEIPEAGGYPDEGVTALGENLALLLRLRGIEVVHGVLPADGVPSHMDTYEKTREAVEKLLTEHPRVGLVIDLRRGAERLSDGSLLRTRGRYHGQTTAQLRLIADSSRGSTDDMRDLAAAVTLRRWLYLEEPTLSRPVYLRQGEGLTTDTSVVMLTLELGTAGNTYEEANALLIPLADALARMIG